MGGCLAVLRQPFVRQTTAAYRKADGEFLKNRELSLMTVEVHPKTPSHYLTKTNLIRNDFYLMIFTPSMMKMTCPFMLLSLRPDMS